MLAESAVNPVALSASYVPGQDSYDEMKQPDGRIRPYWLKFFEHIDAMGRAELEQRWAKARHLLHENGVSYNVYGDPRGVERPWSLSPIPVLLPQREWLEIEAGLAQRARLLNALLHDLYGAQRSLSEGLLPPELVFANPGFLRACHGAHVPRECWLPLYGADLVRHEGGRFAVLEDRTQVPSGAGYALENRIVISSVFSEAFRDCNVERLAQFFRALRDTLASLAPHNRDNPRIVLLTPGPYNATYFEQAYLAQYLGYTLVNGGDLTVRDDRVYLKTLGGLSQVDVILRRLNDDYCDPLELRPESVLGVPGLAQAARSGNVAIASPLGTGLLQTPAFLPYMPGLCRLLLGEGLRLECVRSVWCGAENGLSEAEQLFDDAVVKPAFPEGFVQPVFTAQLAAAARAELLAKLKAEPRKYVVQQHVQGSTTPVLEGGALTPRATAIRCFVVAARDHHVVMPGGLSRVASRTAGTEVSMQLGAGSKDTWIIADEPVGTFTLLPPVDRPVELSRGGSDLPSRAADNLYWLGRYAERAEGVARLARVVATRLGDVASQSELEASTEFVPLLRTLTAQTSLIYTGSLEGAVARSLRAATQQLIDAIFDEHGDGNMKAVLRYALRAGRFVRDRISTDTWRVLASIDEELHEAESELRRSAPSGARADGRSPPSGARADGRSPPSGARADTGEPLAALPDALNRVVLRLAAFSGLAAESMTRGQAWRFLDMGRRLERAMTLVTLLRGTLSTRIDREGPLLEAVLEIADSGMTYRRRYLATLQAAPVVDLLLTDETNPRSVIFQIDALTKHLAALPGQPSGLRGAQERIALGVLTDLKLADIDRLCATDERGARPRLAALLVDLATRVPMLSDSLSDRYLNHATVSRHLSLDEALGRDAFPGREDLP